MTETAPFQAAWWCRNPHLQTLVPYLLRPRGGIGFRRERLELPDGDFLDLDWHETHPADPLVLLLHGLEGSSRSHYVPGLVRSLGNASLASVVLHFRGCSGEPNRLPRRYHAGDTDDLARVLSTLRERYPGRPLAAVGFSLGANVLLKYLGESGSTPPLHAAVAVSTPFRLDRAAFRLQRGVSRLYQWGLLREMRRRTREKYQIAPPGFDQPDLERIRTFREFDEQVTAPLHDFAGADDYYERSSSRSHLRGIRLPTLVIHALDDPLLTVDAIPEASELSSHIAFELYSRGGHVGFVAGHIPWRPRFWLEERIPAWLGENFPVRLPPASPATDLIRTPAAG